MGEERREWGGGASQPASTRARQDVAAPSTAAGSQAYLAVMERAVAVLATESVAAEAAEPEEVINDINENQVEESEAKRFQLEMRNMEM